MDAGGVNSTAPTASRRDCAESRRLTQPCKVRVRAASAGSDSRPIHCIGTLFNELEQVLLPVFSSDAVDTPAWGCVHPRLIVVTRPL